MHTAAPTFTEWHDLEVNDINRYRLHTDFFAFSSDDDSTVVNSGNRFKSKNYLSLDGKWKFHWVANADERPDKFWTVDYDDSAWKTMSVPGIWEVNGYGQPEYVNIGFAWRGHFNEQPPAVPVKDNHVGSYRRIIDIRFDVEWQADYCSLRICHVEYLSLGQRPFCWLFRRF